MIQIRRLNGPDILPFVDDLARLRIQVFREFPYLYDGTLDYERQYIATYADSPRSLFVLALEGARVVGVSTGVPMRDEHEAFRRPFLEHGRNPERVFYFGESVLLPAYRGQGLGGRFFDEREGYAAALGGFDCDAFCAVERPDDHPRRPAGYRPLHDFWARRGYRHHPELRTTFDWKDLDEREETAKPMSFWLREVSA